MKNSSAQWENFSKVRELVPPPFSFASSFLFLRAFPSECCQRYFIRRWTRNRDQAESGDVVGRNSALTNFTPREGGEITPFSARARQLFAVCRDVARRFPSRFTGNCVHLPSPLGTVETSAKDFISFFLFFFFFSQPLKSWDWTLKVFGSSLFYFFLVHACCVRGTFVLQYEGCQTFVVFLNFFVFPFN